VPATRKRTRKPEASLGAVLDRLVAAAAEDPEASFADLTAAAGLDKARDFVGAPLAGLDLRGEDLRGFDFTEADLRKTDFRGANMAGVAIGGADTAGARGLVLRSSATQRSAEPPYDYDEAKRMILAGIAPPAAWVPSILNLDLSGTDLRDLSPLVGLAALRALSCSETQVIDLAPLAGLTALEVLGCSGTRVSDISPLAGLTSLARLDLRRTEVWDFSPLDHLTNLKILGKRRRRRLAPDGDPFGIATMTRGILRGVSSAIRPRRGRS
jgi:hypothetical protein